MSRSILRPLSVVALLLALPLLVRAGPDIEAHYRMSAAAFHALNSRAEQRAEPWRKVAARFEQLHAGSPNHSRGADALFSAALAYQHTLNAGAIVGVATKYTIFSPT